MNCPFCNNEIFNCPTIYGEISEYSCLKCKHGPIIGVVNNEVIKAVCDFKFNNVNYFVLWYFKEDKIVLCKQHTVFNSEILLTFPLSDITPNNIKNKMNLILTFQ